ncbi:MAG: hypothetical protein K2H13_00460 [Eubacterium sp.]|nr:hypothetical protein [Eubacterium sp.]MDE6155828.1 hypothetical protein [Eubacterium sp.]
MLHSCKKCLLLEAGENKSFKEISEYIHNLDDALKVSDEIYQYRLSFCRECDYLISGMCRKCGCYVEVRAILKSKSCPNFDNKKW